MNRDLPTAAMPRAGGRAAITRHFLSAAASSRAAKASIKPHGVRKQGAATTRELEAYPKCL
jgi:hypothetical protein